MGRPTKVLLVDDHLVVRRGTAALLDGIDDVDVVGEAQNGDEAVAQALELRPDVVLMDIFMPQQDGVDATRTILQLHPEIAIVVLTGSRRQQQILDAVQAGAVGFLSKDAERDEFARAIRSVRRGEPWLPPALTRGLLQRMTSRGPLGAPLTSRETDILRLVARGYSNQRIADAAFLAEVTVRSHVSRILGKLGVSNRVEAALWALREGIAGLEET